MSTRHPHPGECLAKWVRLLIQPAVDAAQNDPHANDVAHGHRGTATMPPGSNRVVAVIPQTPPRATPDRPFPWFLGAAGLVMTVIGTTLGALLAWFYYQSGTQCRGDWAGHVAVSYLILIVAPAAGVAMAHVGLHRARTVSRGSSGLAITAVVLAWCVLLVVAGVAGLFALMMILFSNGLPC